ncbi:leucine-rich repeat domain-containing protein [Gimesia panareensis]|uniref:Leucine Rich repeats (2 copies) n=1 Tax=Gimesia panareensis TaxID=2527978 RepID=A0A518AEY2_9PLAN|nr:hypothetical protein [Gimesia panareensis]QDT30180.1 Leucine Rich repeats (2 copies) [Gimesia panareensis]QDU53264.1 Leucine Rich repeats (2 copies) [Gimesia panareensis]
MSNTDDIQSIGSTDRVRRTLLRRSLIITTILLAAALIYSVFQIVRFHEQVAFLQKQGAELETEYRNHKGEQRRVFYEDAPGRLFIPGPVLRYQRSLIGVHLTRSPRISEAETDQFFELLTKFPRIKWVTLEGFHINQQRASALARLKQIESLALRNCTIDESCLATLLERNDLKYFSLADSKFNETELAVFRKQPARDTLRSLSLSNCPVTDQTANLICGCNQLIFLELDGTRISDKGVKILARLPSLKVLVLDHTDVTDSGVAYLSATPHLVELSLSNTSTSDEMLESLQLEIPALRVSDD